MGILQPVTTEQDSAAIAEKILRALSHPFYVCNHKIRISASIRIAVYPLHGEEVNQLLKHADAAMYAAKKAGCNNFRLFDPSVIPCLE